MSWVQPLVSTLVAITLLAGIAVAGSVLFRIERPSAAASALLRAIVQLTLLSVVLSGIITNLLWVAIALLVMLAAAVSTVARRIHANSHESFAVAAAMATAVAVVSSIVFTTGALEPSARYALAFCGILIGNTMSIATLTGRLFRQQVRDHWEEVEGWLALGAMPAQSTRALARTAMFNALVPSIDQTRTTGIVVLPGAFVGAVFGGASPLEAGRFQLLVLAGILAAGVITATLLLRQTGAVAIKPE